MADHPEPVRAQTKIVVPGAHSMVSLLGSRDELLRIIEQAFASDIHVRGNEITITGNPDENAIVARLFEELITLMSRGDVLTADSVERSLAMLRGGTDERPADVLTLNILSNRGRTIRPKTLNQKRYVDAIDQHTVVFGIGPAGTGKTYLAMAKAVQALQAKQVNRIILTRPAVEAGERLGFLPGTLYEKIDPYLRPLYDALHDMIDPESIPRLMAAGTDRGRAAGLHAWPDAERRVHHPRRGAEHLGRADEDVPHPAGLRLQDGRHGRRHQTDLPARHHLRAASVQEILGDIDDVAFLRLTSSDVVRHRLVGEIVDAYARHDVEQLAPSTQGRKGGGRPSNRR